MDLSLKSSTILANPTSAQTGMLNLNHSSNDRPVISVDMHIISIIYEMQILLKKKIEMLRLEQHDIWKWRRMGFPTANRDSRHKWKVKRNTNEFEIVNCLRVYNALKACRDV